jgi:hypothetical protein
LGALFSPKLQKGKKLMKEIEEMWGLIPVFYSPYFEYFKNQFNNSAEVRTKMIVATPLLNASKHQIWQNFF